MEKTPYIGAMNRLVTLYTKETVVNEVSEHKEMLVEAVNPWAKMEDKSGAQVVDGEVYSTVNRTYTIRRIQTVVQNGLAMVLGDGALQFEVISMREIGRTHLELHVRSVGNVLPVKS